MISGVKSQTNYFVFLSFDEIVNLEFEPVKGPLLNVDFGYEANELSVKLYDQEKPIDFTSGEISIFHKFYQELKEHLPTVWIDFDYSLYLFNADSLCKKSQIVFNDLYNHLENDHFNF